MKRTKKPAGRKETVTAGPAPTGAVRVEPVRTEPAPTAVVRPEPVRTEPVKPEPPRVNRVLLEFLKPGAKQVCVAGSFNQWKPEQTPLLHTGDGRWVGNVTVRPGRHEYLFVVDGQWVPDPNARESVANPFGGKNSVLAVSE